MGIQDKISSNQYSWLKKLNDYKIDISGSEAQTIRLKVEEDMYGDPSEISIVSHNRINIVLDIPGDLPIDRLREDVTMEIGKTQSIFLYDIIPIVGYAKFEDNIEKDDILIRKIFTDNLPESEPYYIILRVSDILGNVTIRHITRKHFNCAPYNESLPQKVQDIIDSYKDLD